MSAFIDTSAFLAILNSEDTQHDNAVRIWSELIDNQELIITSNYVVVETTSLLHSRHGIPAVRRFTEDMLPAILVEWVDASTHTTAVSSVLAAASKNSPSLVDCVSFEIIRKSKIIQVFAYDRHYEGRGFDLVG